MYWFTARDFIDLNHADYKDESMCIIINDDEQLELVYNILDCYYKNNNQINIL